MMYDSLAGDGDSGVVVVASQPTRRTEFSRYGCLIAARPDRMIAAA